MHKVCMGFMLCNGWHVYFMLPDLQMHLTRKLTFGDQQRFVEMGCVAGTLAGRGKKDERIC
jgi:hypothetical protein